MIQSSGARNAHHEYAANIGQKSAQAILRFFFTNGGHYISVALKLYQSKMVPQLLYGTTLGSMPLSFIPLE